MKITHRHKESFIISILLILLAFFLQPTLKSIDDIYTDIKFNSRGKQQIDTSIVTLFFTDDDLQTLGGLTNLPNHTALIISALNNIGAKAIGVNILFDEQINYQGSERRHFISTVKSSPNVSLACYFQTIGSGVDTIEIKTEDNFDSSPKIDSASFRINFSSLPIGNKLLSPYPKLIKNEQIGHLNYSGKTVARKIPLLLKSNSGEVIPSFSLELTSVFLGIPKDSITVNKRNVVLHGNRKKITIPTDNGEMLINYSGSSENLQKFTAVKFLNSYINFITGKTPELPLESFKNKIVLIAIDSKVLGQLLINPFNERMPILGVQANAIDTILRNRFIFEFSPWIVFLFSFIFLFIICYILLSFKVVISFLVALVLTATYTFLSFYYFGNYIQLPVHPILLAPLAIVLSLLYKFAIDQRHSDELENISEEDSDSLSIVKKKRFKSKGKLTDKNINSANNSKLNSSEGNAIRSVTEESNKPNSELDFEKINFSETTREFNGMVFNVKSPLNGIVDVIEKIAPSNAAVLITGESGTGKELTAKSIHDLSNRSEKMYVPINCATLQENLLESELFGYEKGAFTGAEKQKIGLFETANFGTLFLDEISEMSENLQSKLLRVLQSNEFYRVGGTESIKIDVRIVAATNKDPHLEVRAKRFREDLYYRLNTIHIELPPLRKRKEDIPILINKFLGKEKENNFNLSRDVLEALLNYNWPGNVRQLEGVIEHAVIFAKSEQRNAILMKDLPKEFFKGVASDNLEENILTLLRNKEFSRNSINETAKELGGLNRGTITEYLRGILLRGLSENSFDLQKTSEIMAMTNDPKIIDYVMKKNAEYLINIRKHLNKNLTNEENIERLKKKYKNLPKRYHIFLEEFIHDSLK